MRDKRVSTILAITVLTAVLTAFGCGSKTANSNANANNQPTTIDVTTTQAVTKPIPTYFEATGNLKRCTDQRFPVVAGKVLEVNFDVGSYVTKGSVMVKLDPRDAQIGWNRPRHR